MVNGGVERTMKSSRVFVSLCEMHSLVFVLNRSKVKATFETAFEIVFETFHATFNVFVVKE